MCERHLIPVSHVCRVQFTTEPPVQPPKKKKRLRKFLLYTTAATATFYTGSAFLAFKNASYYDFFVEKVPLGAAFLQYAEDNNWDTLTPQKAQQSLQDAVAYAQRLVSREKAEEAAGKAKEELDKAKAKAAASNMYQGAKDKVKAVAQTVKTTVERGENAVTAGSSKAVAIAKHQAEAFETGVDDLVRKAEAAIGKEASKTAAPDATTTPSQPSAVAPDAVPPHENDTAEASLKDVSSGKKGEVYGAPLPIGFEPPPGYARPAPPKPKPTSEVHAEKAAPLPPLPLVAPAVKEFAASEPVISQLASVIDNLASYLNTNPSAAAKATDILDVAKTDLKSLADRIEEVKADERKKLEATLDEQTREYSLSLMELEMTAQDKLDSQEEGFKRLFEEEKAKFVAAYREKLNKELETQSEIINER